MNTELHERRAPSWSRWPASAGLIAAFGALVLLVTVPTAAAAVQAPQFDWAEEMAAGTTLYVATFSGNIQVTASSDRNARVHGQVRGDGRASDADLSRIGFEVVRADDTIVLCAVNVGGGCTNEGVRAGNGRDRIRARADFTIEVPRGVVLRVTSHNGELQVEGATASVQASSGNGRVTVGPGAERVQASSGNGRVQVREARGPVRASSGNGAVRVSTLVGPVNASTGNGGVEVRMGSLPPGGDMEFSTGNGSVVLHLPDDFSAEVEATSGNGGLESDFPILMQGRTGNRGRLWGTIGEGGRTVTISTGNGRIELRRSTSD